MPARIAVIGGGIFGCTTAIELARAGHSVELFERHDRLLAEASGINQYRIHRGYHYPRSLDTAMSAKASEAEFRSYFAEAIVGRSANYYAIAKEGSLTSAKEYVAFCDDLGLDYDEETPAILKRDVVDLCIRVREALFDPDALRQICGERLDKHGVRLALGVSFLPEQRHGYDLVVSATYSRHNDFVPGQAYQFEVCEKPVVALPESWTGLSIVVMDGPFCCIDPFARTGRFVMGNVVHAIHHSNVGLKPEIPSELAPFLNRGIVTDTPLTNFKAFVEDAGRFFTNLDEIKHLGSMYTIRTVLPDKEDTDERPTIVSIVDGKTAMVFSGKISTCVAAAREIVRHADSV